jgi:hypothetical protein
MIEQAVHELFFASKPAPCAALFADPRERQLRFDGLLEDE